VIQFNSAITDFDAQSRVLAAPKRGQFTPIATTQLSLFASNSYSIMLGRFGSTFLLFLFLVGGCSRRGTPQPVQLKYKATGSSPEILALYEAWFGFAKHINPGYSSHDTAVLHRQIQQAKGMGISGFVVDWYGDREPFIDQSYALMQTAAAKEHFHVAMMYDESDQEDGATDEAVADFTMFHDTYLTKKSSGHEAYLTYQGRPVIFIWPKGKHTNWDQVRTIINKWKPAPLLIALNPPGKYADAFDGYYAWINPGSQGWAADGSHWGEDYLSNFYRTMGSKYADKIIVAGAWSQFNDTKASWSLNRHMSPRCGQTYQDTFNLWRKYFPADQPIPFLMLETWNDYEEGSAMEPGIATCAKGAEAPASGQATQSPTPPAQP
jgi:hypothetical protein